MMLRAKSRKAIKGSHIKEDRSVLSNDIIFSILIKVYAASLLRFKCVSKSWNAMISNVKFTKDHRDQSKELGHEKLLLKRSTGEFELIHLNDPSKDIIEKQHFPQIEFRGAHVLCSYDGLVVLKKPKAYKKFILWNPSSGQHQILECPFMKPHEYTFPHACGLCYDSTTGDYKIILIYSLFYVVYSTSTGSWTKKTISLVLQQCLGYEILFKLGTYVCSQGISIEGYVYWSLSRKLDHYVIYYDVKSNELKESSALIFVDKDAHLFHLSTLKGRLCAYGGYTNSSELDIWIMEQDGWKWFMKICNIPSLNCDHFLCHYKLLRYTKDGEFIFHRAGYNNLSIYYPKQQRFVRTTPISNQLGYVFCPVDTICLDSLYFPRLHATHKRKQSNTQSE